MWNIITNNNSQNLLLLRKYLFDNYVFVRGPLDLDTNCFSSVLYVKWSFDWVINILTGLDAVSWKFWQGYYKIFLKEMNLIIEANIYIWIWLKEHF
jgi:hypothetical protein